MEKKTNQSKRGIVINFDLSVKDYIWKPATFTCENGKQLASIIVDSVITCDEIRAETKTITTTFSEKRAACKTLNSYIFCIFVINHYNIIDSCQYFILSDKILSKMKTFVTIFLSK